MDKRHTLATHKHAVDGHRFLAQLIAGVLRIVPLIGIEQFVRLKHAPACSNVS
jgi:hypothetical protein